MSRRPPSAPPVIRGFEHVKLLGSGGFADVFLYQQHHPRREVAIKVALKDRSGTATHDSFTAEANVMAPLANHPSIVSVYEAGVSDDGRPYLVMEYCSRPNLQVRHRRERFNVAETLRIGIQIAGAVETAHRAGILHRDIKPANILVTDFGRPALTDFGISAATTGEMAGMSVPWSPPESFRMPPEGFASSDVYSLAATLFTLLVDRSPFQLVGASNTEMDVIGRIQSMPPPPTGRSDVPASLEAVLARAMAKDPGARYDSALEFSYALQRVQIELGMPTTVVDVVEDEIASAEDGDDEGGRTRFTPIASIDAQAEPVAPAPSPQRSAPTASSPVEESTVRPPGPSEGSDTVHRVAPAPTVPSPQAIPDTIVRAGQAVPEPAPPQRRRSRVLTWVLAGAAVAVAGVVVTALVLAPRGVGDPAAEPTAGSPVDPIGGAAGVPDVTELTGTAENGEVVFTWTNPEPESGDTYLWRPVVPGETFQLTEIDEPTASVPADAAGRACIEVLIRRAGGAAGAEGVQGCAP